MRIPNRPTVPYFRKDSPQAKGCIAAWPMFFSGSKILRNLAPGAPPDSHGTVDFTTCEWNADNDALNIQPGDLGGWGFNNIGSGITFPTSYDPLAGTNQWSITAWVKPNSNGPGSWSRIVSKRTSGGGSDTYCLGAESDNEWFSRLNGTEIAESSASYYVIGEWVHLVATWTDSNSVAGTDTAYPQLFVNGLDAARAAQELNGTTNSSTAGFRIGNRYLEETGRRFRGHMADIRLYNINIARDIGDGPSWIMQWVEPATRWELYTQPIFQMVVPEITAATQTIALPIRR